MDLELMFSSIISLCMANWEKWTKFFTDLLVSVLGYTIFIFTVTLFTFTFFRHSKRNTFTILSPCQLHLHICLIKLILLQLHHRTSLTTIMFITRDPLTLITCAPPTLITCDPLTWNTSILLFASNDVELNPGLLPIDQNPVIGWVYSNKIYHGIQQDMALTWSIGNCNARSRKAYNGLSIHQISHAKNFGCSITWKCSHHGTGIAKIITPPPPVYEIPSCPSGVGKSCSVCKNPIWASYADLAYHCANPSCDNVCHLSAICSGFVNP